MRDSRAMATNDGPDGRDNPTPGDDEPRLRSDAIRNRERLLDAAAEVFAEQGPQGGVLDVARHAGVGVGTLYRHFPTKTDLVNELVDTFLTDLIQAACNSLSEPDGRGLEHFLQTLGAQQTSRGSIGRLWNTPHHAALIDELQQATDELLADAQRHGKIRPELTPADLVAVIWSIRGVIEMTRHLAPDAYKRFLQVILTGLSPTPVPPTEEPLPMNLIVQARAPHNDGG
jgi:AcrR family transcriptional regulator